MPKMPINWLTVEAPQAFQTFPVGQYGLRIADVRQENSQSSGEPKLTVYFEVEHGPNGSAEFINQRMVRSYTLSQKGLGFTKRFLFACGITDQDLAAAQGFIDDQALIGARIVANVKVREYNGRTVNDIGEERPAQGALQTVQGAPQAVQGQVTHAAPYAQAPQYQQPQAPQYQQPQAPQVQPPISYQQPLGVYTAPTQGAYAPGFGPGNGNGQVVLGGIPPAPPPPTNVPPTRVIGSSRS